MPRGFLVKRNKKSSPVSYRVRTEEKEDYHQLREPHPPSADVLATGPGDTVLQPSPQRSNPEPFNHESAQDKVSEANQAMGSLLENGAFYTQPPFAEYNISRWASVPYSPAKPLAKEPKNPFVDRCLVSPAPAESFPVASTLNPIERLLLQPTFSAVRSKGDGAAHLFSPLHLPASGKRGAGAGEQSQRKSKAGQPAPAPTTTTATTTATKKPKVIRKLSFQDEMTTSPVLGLRIKVDAGDSKRCPSTGGGALGEFICQLCKEQYPDPFSLAQHKCSRIIRVEYRCPECDKVFSCPANLASHRRWHKPRPGTNGDAQAVKKQGEADSESKENSGKRGGGSESPGVIRIQHLDSSRESPGGAAHTASSTSTSTSSTSSSSSSTSSSALLAGEELFQCCYCNKTFRRQAYLRKHLAAHQAARCSVSTRVEELSRLSFPCQLCGVHLPSAEIRDKHLLWHAMGRGEAALLGPGPCPGPGDRCTEETPNGGEPAAQIYSCKHCPSTFVSSPGLTRHINKCHPSESRQVLLLQIPLRPGC